MKFSATLSAGLALAGLGVAAPLSRRDGKTAAQIIGEISPNSLTCSGAPECRTNEQVAPYFVKAMNQYGLGSPGQIAAVLALTAYESVDYKYKHNVSPGRPGQGTSNMQMLSFNIEYAQSITALKEKVAAIAAPASAPDKVLDLLTDDEYNFGSGPWFLKNKCAPSVADGLAQATDAAFDAYMACVGVSTTPERKAYWTRAKTAFGL
ncbi:hypothetical protein F5Y14DRAFT_33682 [Nemania sp. NC0429]|nr:hypothetical protein F5Y14DRAFT_33682 [Nemania sp. NC0429]